VKVVDLASEPRCWRSVVCTFGHGFVTILTSACAAFDLPPAPAELYAPCCSGQSVCVPKALVEAQFQSRLGHGECGEDLLCVPSGVLHAGAAPFASCGVQSTGAEGRCLPQCLPDVARWGELVQVDGCAPEQRCVPCFDPRSGAPTGACSFGSDPGPRAQAVVFANCCSGSGRCVPQGSIPSDQRSMLGVDSCTVQGNLCVPEPFVTSPDAIPARCTVEALAVEGRCLPACLPAVARQANRLASGVCKAGELCTPCFDPVSGEPSGACSLRGDPGPIGRPRPLAQCCGGVGRCVPASLLRTEGMQLVREACTSADDVCAPAALVANPGAMLPRCTSLVGGPGGCVPSCLLDGLASIVLSQDVCAYEERCVPCPQLGSMCPG
jgi:hypothetical protein